MPWYAGMPHFHTHHKSWYEWISRCVSLYPHTMVGSKPHIYIYTLLSLLLSLLLFIIIYIYIHGGYILGVTIPMRSAEATEAMSAEERRGALAAMPEVRLGQSMGRP